MSATDPKHHGPKPDPGGFTAPTRDKWGRPQESYGSTRGRSIRQADPAAPCGWNGAAFNDDRTHRYTLARSFDAPLWQATSRRVLWIMLNPSTADETVNDPTIRRCCGYSQAWGFDSMAVANLFSLRSTDPKALYPDVEAEGDPDNLVWICDLASSAHLIVCAWGMHGALRERARFVTAELRRDGRELHYLGWTTHGQPKHPLYLPKTLKPKPWVAA